jgi:replicative DNA helicase
VSTFRDQLLSDVRREIRLAGMAREPLPLLPLPNDMDAEGEILSALLADDMTISDLAPLASGHFYADLHRAVWDAIAECGPGNVDAVERFMTTRGRGAGLARELATLAFTQPWRSHERLREKAAKLIDLAEQRQLIEVMQRVDLGLRAGTLDMAGALERLAGVFG